MHRLFLLIVLSAVVPFVVDPAVRIRDRASGPVAVMEAEFVFGGLAIELVAIRLERVIVLVIVLAERRARGVLSSHALPLVPCPSLFIAAGLVIGGIARYVVAARSEVRLIGIAWRVDYIGKLDRDSNEAFKLRSIETAQDAHHGGRWRVNRKR